MIYLLDPKEVYGARGCKKLAYPLYGLPCPGVCPTLCILIPL